MNSFADEIIKKIGIGKKILDISNIENGLINTSFKMETDSGDYFIKKLAAKYRNNLDGFIKSEKIAKEFEQHNIPTVSTIPCNEEIICRIDNEYFAVYPWVDGQTLSYDEMNTVHWEELGRLLSRLHNLNITEPNMKEQWNSYSYPMGHWDNLFQKHEKNETIRKYGIIKNLDTYSINAFNAKNQVDNFIINHRDLRPDNLIWCKNSFTIIDWECAGVVSPEIELYSVALTWSGLERLEFNKKAFNTIIASYLKNRPHLKLIDKEIGFWSTIGDNLWWLDFNLNRENIVEEKERALTEICRTLDIINFLITNISRLI